MGIAGRPGRKGKSMSLYVKALCGNCKSKFELYHNTLQTEKGYRCPHCMQKIPHKTWERLIDAFMTTRDLNYQTLKAHNEREKPLFIFEFVNKEIPMEKVKGD